MVEIPVWEKYALTIDEAGSNSHIRRYLLIKFHKFINGKSSAKSFLRRLEVSLNIKGRSGVHRGTRTLTRRLEPKSSASANSAIWTFHVI